MSAELKAVKVLKLAAVAAVTETGDGTAIDLSGYDGDALLVLNATATGGADETYDGKIYHCATSNGTFTDSGVAFTQVTNAAASHQVKAVSIDKFKRYVKLRDVMAGTTPAVTRSAELVVRSAR